MNRSYTYPLLPNTKQKACIQNILNCVCLLHNYYVADLLDGKINTKSSKIVFDKYVNIHPELKKCDPSALFYEIFHMLDNESCNRIITYKSKYTTSYFTKYKQETPITKSYVYLPTVGHVRYKNTRQLPNNAILKSFTIKQSFDDKYFISIAFEVKDKISNISLDISNSIGLDYSSPCFIVDSNGIRLEAPHYFKRARDDIKKQRLKLRKYPKDSKRYAKEMIKLIKMHKKVANKRNNFLHHLSKEYAKKYDYIFVEDLNLDEISRKKNLGIATHDNAYYEFLKYLGYKAKDNNHKLIKVNRYFPSTKKCHNCGYINRNLTLKDRIWECPNCHMIHDRDYNSALNIKYEGISIVCGKPMADRCAL